MRSVLTLQRMFANELALDGKEFPKLMSVWYALSLATIGEQEVSRSRRDTAQGHAAQSRARRGRHPHGTLQTSRRSVRGRIKKWRVGIIGYDIPKLRTELERAAIMSSRRRALRARTVSGPDSDRGDANRRCIAGAVSGILAPMKTVDPKTERAVRTFLERISQRYSVIGARLFGSRSRADHNPGSDVDLAVFLRGSRGNAIDVGVDMAGVAFDVLMDTEILVSPLPIWEDDWAHPEAYSNPLLLENIRRDGIVL